MNIQIINVKLPFIEAIEHLHSDNNAIGCVCLDNTRPCVITLTENRELRIIEEDIFTSCVKKFEEFTDRLLSLENVLQHEWYMVYKILN